MVNIRSNLSGYLDNGVKNNKIGISDTDNVINRQKECRGLYMTKNDAVFKKIAEALLVDYSSVRGKAGECARVTAGQK